MCCHLCPCLNPGVCWDQQANAIGLQMIVKCSVGEKRVLCPTRLISMLFCKTRRERLVHMPLEGVVRISQIRSAFLHKYVKVLSKCCMIYGRKALEWQPSASPSHSTVYARLVPTGVQKKKKKKGMYQMHQVSHCPSKKVPSKPVISYVSLETASCLLDLWLWLCIGLGIVQQWVMEFCREFGFWRQPYKFWNNHAMKWMPGKTEITSMRLQILWVISGWPLSASKPFKESFVHWLVSQDWGNSFLLGTKVAFQVLSGDTWHTI